MLVFAFVDPATLSLPGGAALALSATAVYSVAFFVFWAAAAAACALTLLLARGAEDINVPPLTAAAETQQLLPLTSACSAGASTIPIWRCRTSSSPSSWNARRSGSPSRACSPR